MKYVEPPTRKRLKKEVPKKNEGGSVRFLVYVTALLIMFVIITVIDILAGR